MSSVAMNEVDNNNTTVYFGQQGSGDNFSDLLINTNIPLISNNKKNTWKNDTKHLQRVSLIS